MSLAPQERRRRAARFFADHSSGIVGQAFLRGYQLALAEEIADKREWSVLWGQDCCPDLSWCEECQESSDHREQHAEEVYSATLFTDSSDPYSGSYSTSGIDRPKRDDRRVVEAELALEALRAEYNSAEQNQSLEAYLRAMISKLDRPEVARRATAPHARCAGGTRCLEHAQDRRVQSCKLAKKNRSRNPHRRPR